MEKYKKYFLSFCKQVTDQESFDYIFPLALNNQFISSHSTSMFSHKSLEQLLSHGAVFELAALAANMVRRVIQTRVTAICF